MQNIYHIIYDFQKEMHMHREGEGTRHSGEAGIIGNMDE